MTLRIRFPGIAASGTPVAAVFAACLLLGPSGSFAQVATGATRSFDSNGFPIHYMDRGGGLPVVLIHGFTGSSARHWEAPGMVRALDAAGYRVIAMDCRGHGESGKPHDAGQYGLEMVGDVIRLLDHLGIDRVHVVGYSMGGAVANQLLVKHPRRLITVTLLGAGWEGDDLSALSAQFAALADGFDKKDASPLIRAVTSAGQNGPTAEEVAAMNAALFARNDAAALAAAARGLLPLYRIPAGDLRAVSLPVLAIIGEQDTFNLERVQRMAAIVRGMEVVRLPGATHASSVRPAAEPLVAFLNKHRTAGNTRPPAR